MARPRITPIETKSTRPKITPLQEDTSSIIGMTSPARVDRPLNYTPYQAPTKMHDGRPYPEMVSAEGRDLRPMTAQEQQQVDKMRPIRYGGAGIKGAIGELQNIGRNIKQNTPETINFLKNEAPLTAIPYGIGESFVKGIPRAITKTGEFIGRYAADPIIGKLTGIDTSPGSDYAKGVKNWYEARYKDFSPNEDNILQKTSAGKAVSDLSGMAGELIPTIIVAKLMGVGKVSMLGKGAKGVKGSAKLAEVGRRLPGTAIFYGKATQSYYDQYIQEGYSHEEAEKASLVSGVHEIVFNNMGVNPMNPNTYLKSVSGNVILNAAQEFTISTANNTVVRKGILGEDLKELPTLMQEALIAGAYGGALGGIMTGGSHMFVNSSAITRELAQKIETVPETLTVQESLLVLKEADKVIKQQTGQSILENTQQLGKDLLKSKEVLAQGIEPTRPTITPMQQQAPQKKVKLYHGSDTKIDQFNFNKVNQRDVGDFGEAIYLTPSKLTAQKYGKIITETDVDLGNVLKLKNDVDWQNFMNEAKINGTTLDNQLENYMEMSAKERTNLIKNLGYDSVHDVQGNQYAVFDTNKTTPTQQVDNTRLQELKAIDTSEMGILERSKIKTEIRALEEGYNSIESYQQAQQVKKQQAIEEAKKQKEQKLKQQEQAKQEQENYFKNLEQKQNKTTKEQQLLIINKKNPAPNDYQVWVRSVEDILTPKEAFSNYEATYPDFTKQMAKNALEKGTVMVYSSTPIVDGNFVSTSKIMAQDYAGGKDAKVYQQLIDTKDVAWINSDEGQVAKLGTISQSKMDDIIQTKPLTEKQLAKQKVAEIEAKVVETLKKDITKAYSKVIPSKFSKQYVKVIKKNPDLVKDIVATKPNGKLAIRDTGVFTPKMFDKHKFKDIKGFAGQQSYNLLAAAGEFDNVTIQQAARKGEWGPMKQFAYNIDKSIANRQVYVVNEVAKIESIAKKHNVKINAKTGQQLFDALEGRPTTPQMKALATDIRAELNKLRLDANIHRQALGKSKIGFIKDYVPHMQKVNFFNKKMGDSQTTISDNFDFMIPNAKVNPHAIARTGAEFNMETNAWKLLDTYVNSISNDVYTTPMIEQAKSVNQVIMDKNPAMGNFMNTYIKEQLVGQTAKIDRILGMQPGTIKKDVATKIMRARNTAALGGNFVWSLTTQPASMANTVARTGFGNTFKGLMSYATNKQVRNQIKQLPSMTIKSKGKSVGRTVGGDIDRLSATIGKTKIDKFNDFLGLFPDAMESVLTGASAAASYEQGRKIGLIGQALDMYADTVAQTTQSMYNKEARPVIMNNTSIRLAAPFQTFAFEQYRYAKQLAGKGGGIPLEARDRLAQAMRLIIAMWLFSKFAEETTGRKLNTPGTFVPFLGGAVDEQLSKVGQTVGLTPREYSGSGRSLLAPLEEGKNVWEATDALVQYGNFTPMRKELVKWGMGLTGVGGASTVNRFVDGIIASQKGYQETRAGRVAFPITSTKDKITAITMGPYATKPGKEYIKGGFKPLGEKQSETIKSSTNIERDFNAMMKTREYNKLVNEYNKLRSEGKSTIDIERKIKSFK